MAEWMMYRYTGSNANGTPARPRTAADAKQWNLHSTDALGRTISASAAPPAPAPAPLMDATRGSVSSASTTQSTKLEDSTLLANPFALRHGRRYLRELPYPLPCDLPELQRQNLHTLLATSVFGRPLGSNPDPERPPRKVLEIACGSAYWTSLCHDYFHDLGYEDVQYTGLDVVPIAGDLRKQNIDWRFVQHDLRKVPLPFDDGEFDIVVMKDMSLVVPLGSASQRILDEAIRILKSGGTLEIWETDHVIRSILPHPPPPPGKNPEEYACAVATATFMISPITPFTEVHNKFLNSSNNWITEALDKRKLSPTPCARISQMLLQETETLQGVENRRVAIPLGELRWEREAAAERHSANRRGSEAARTKKGAHFDSVALTEEQAALRHTALLVVIQMIESLEPLLKEVSGKSQEEWQTWWGSMMTNLLQEKGASSGECLEIGVWWCQKV